MPNGVHQAHPLSPGRGTLGVRGGWVSPLRGYPSVLCRLSTIGVSVAINQLAGVTPEQARIIAELRQQGVKPPQAAVAQAAVAALPIKDWAETYFYIPETGRPVQLEPLQVILYNYFLDLRSLPPFGFTEMLWTAVKKSAKTASAAIMARYVAETWGFKQEIYVLANDEEQAKGRIWQSVRTSIELDPDYDKHKRILTKSGQAIWRVTDDKLEHLPSGSTIVVVNIDYRGAAGGNPSATFFSELWGYTREAHRKVFDELTPVPTRARSIRWVETYAGFEGESLLLREIWDRAQKEGRRLTRAELEPYGGWPYDDPDDELPIWVHEPSRTLAYIDQNLPGKPTYARRMPWLTGERGEAYYQQQAATLLPEANDRLHNNLWQNAQSAFMTLEQYYRNYDPTLPPLMVGSREVCVVAVDASVSGDCTAATLHTRHPDPAKKADPAMRQYRVWTPPKGGKLNYQEPDGLEETLRKWIAQYNVHVIVYDEYQLHDMMNRFRRENLCSCHVFSQGQDRMVADKMLYDVIMQLRFHHRDVDGAAHGSDSDFAEQLKNAAKQQNAKEDTKLRIVKAGIGKIDVVVAASMGNHEILRLLV